MAKLTTELHNALSELVEVIKDHRQSVLAGMTRREVGFLTDALHKANLALHRAALAQKKDQGHE